MPPNESPHCQESGDNLGNHETNHTDDRSSESSREDLVDEDDPNLDMDANEGLLTILDTPLDADDILLGADDVEVLLDENDEDDMEEEAPTMELDPATNKDLSIPEEHRWLPQNLEAGCIWDADNWSCAFDAVFMAFYLMYGQSDQTWRGTWKGESPEWNMPLGNSFDLLLSITTTYDPQECSLWFSRCRDIFRDKVTESNPICFPRGREPAPVGDILQRIFGGASAEPLACQHLICIGCGAEKYDTRSLSFLPYAFNINLLRRHRDPNILPLQLALSRYVGKYTTEPASSRPRCQVCQAAQQVRSLDLPDTSWIWFEAQTDKQLVLPSFEINYPPQQIYTLQAVIYLGGRHFTARIRKGPSTWWNYDGMRKLGKPQLETIETEEELLGCDGRDFAFLIYRCGGGN